LGITLASGHAGVHEHGEAGSGGSTRNESATKPHGVRVIHRPIGCSPRGCWWWWVSTARVQSQSQSH